MTEETTEKVPYTIEDLRASNPLFENLPDLPEPYKLTPDQTIHVTLAAQVVRDEYAKLNATLEANKPKDQRGKYDKNLVLKDSYEVLLSQGTIIKAADELMKYLAGGVWESFTEGREFSDLFSIAINLVLFYEVSLGKHRA